MDKEELISLMKTNIKGKIRVHDCSMCGYECGYIFNSDDPENLFYYSGCDCVGYSNVEPRTVDSIINWYEMQLEQRHKDAVLAAISGLYVSAGL